MEGGIIINREQRRRAYKQIKKKLNTSDKEVINRFISTVEEASLVELDSFDDGDKVKLDADKIVGRKDFDNMTESYRNFVTSNRDKVFTAHIEQGNLVSFEEVDEFESFLFLSSDLILVEKKEEEDGQSEG